LGKQGIGNWLLVIGYWLLVIGYWLLAKQGIGHRALGVGSSGLLIFSAKQQA
jgi:hypothetical protein